MLSKYLVLAFLVHSFISLKCGQNEIVGCKQCDTDENKNKCLLCEDKYFSVLDGLNCVKCDDQIFGMEGCSGKCEFIKSEKKLLCKNNSCKDGFYEKTQGICERCSNYNEKCIKCSYSNENGELSFKCLECEQYHYLTLDGKCQFLNNCIRFLNETFCLECDNKNIVYNSHGECKYFEDYNCIKIKYSNEENSYICEECREGYFIPEGQKRCYLECRYYKYNCVKCHFEGNEILCDKAEEGYFISKSENKIKRCDTQIENCTKCSFELDNDTLKCNECVNNAYLSSDGKQCKNCYENDNGCIICSDEPKTICDKCAEGYTLTPEGYCLSCKNTFGEECISCSISPYNFLPYCKKCINGYFVNLEGKCQNGNEDNTNGCNSFKAFGKNGYKCGGCQIGYIFNNGICLKKNEAELNNCYEIKNIGTRDNIILSCVSCNYNYILAIKENNVQICIDPNHYYNLQNCNLCKKEGNNNFVCIECKGSFSLSIIKENKTMCINVDSIAGCGNYYIENNEIKCKKCKNGYSLISSNNCLKCEEKCEICYLDNSNIIQCKKYIEPYFLNNSIV